jgi:membrane protein
MSAQIENELLKIPIVRNITILLKRVILPGFNGLSLYDFLETYIMGIIKGTFSSRASSIAYSFFLALFPFLLFILNLISVIPIDGFQVRFLAMIEDVLPPNTHDFFYPVIEDIALNPRAGLLSMVFFLSLFLAANGVNSIFSSFEYSVHVKLNRNFFKQYVFAVCVSIVLAMLLLFAVGCIVYGEYLINSLKGSDLIINKVLWISILQITLLVIVIYISIAILYYFGTVEGKKSRFFSIGALVTTLLFLITTYLFGIYIDNFSQYNELYGSIGALLIMMLYIWINANLLLLGFELNASLQRLRDTC